jgi:ribosomal protein S18 acetylase RimI-like enzyme
MHDGRPVNANNRFQIRQLGASDAAAFRPVRLEALARHPEAFGASHEEEAAWSADDYAARMEETAVFGGFEEHTLMGIVGFSAQAPAKMRHKGILWGLYVREAARGAGLGEALVRAVIEHARGQVEIILLTVVSENEAACRFYERCGFTRYGIEPRALKLGGRYYDEALMMLRFDGKAR